MSREMILFQLDLEKQLAEANVGRLSNSLNMARYVINHSWSRCFLLLAVQLKAEFADTDFSQEDDL